jgi:hypothetical protein
VYRSDSEIEGSGHEGHEGRCRQAPREIAIVHKQSMHASLNPSRVNATADGLKLSYIKYVFVTHLTRDDPDVK